MAKKKKGKKRTVHIPGMADVETRSLIPEGDYLVEVSNVEQKESERSEYDYLNWEFTISKGDYKGQKLWLITSFNPKALWNLKNLLEALDADIPDEPEDVLVDDLLGLELSVTVEHDRSYDGNPRAKITAFESAEGGEDEEEVEVQGEDEEDDELEKISEDKIRDMDEEELAELVEKYELEVNLKKLKNLRKKVNAVVDAMEEEGHLEDEDDED